MLKFVDQFVENGHVDPTRDMPNVRLLNFSNGQTIRLERKNPYGFISVVWNKGPTPEKLSGIYTTFDYATKAVEIYVNNEMASGVKVVDEPVALAPSLQYKKAYRDKTTGENIPQGV